MFYLVARDAAEVATESNAVSMLFSSFSPSQTSAAPSSSLSLRSLALLSSYRTRITVSTRTKAKTNG